ncbi:protein chibby homolog 1-like [Brienomyrus brachyistius]|uniref:protein chibby homolog 1-like n=1 Tax=Brienomyrus brachyistius TaxID=42636 RepID=UPI0020B3E2F0|nr:protein chibby homolog 1-like [Brienomyrus brachyistius]XP_048885703.1 protein chibby homolog 1-like [Brienomyrus brachyistius]XP_048885704.1 protein chibby homolog 1-like [Brienomyrus brachyistius]XP_048885705.1 protein chibby homolog 1-like [Brienomyrus brachyistius]XP_048885706.1 protein chibby homolog 1-like [Brienomyrus brachyistius]XP_048885707.1 protein chibby homolog 1-like [Brienomyrus brachyistius]
MSFVREVLGKLGNSPSYSGNKILWSTWNPKRVPLRQDASLSSHYTLDYRSRMEELGSDLGLPTLTLAGQTFTYINGQWVSSAGRKGLDLRPRLQQLKRKNRALMEENNALMIRLEVLMDMLTDATAQLRELQADATPRHKRGLMEVFPNKWP